MSGVTTTGVDAIGPAENEAGIASQTHLSPEWPEVREIVVLRPAPEGRTLYEVHEPSPDPSRYVQGVRCRDVAIRGSTVNAQLHELASRDFDVVINLCDGAADEDRPGIEVVTALERLRIPFTGASSRCFDPSRDSQKMAAWSAGFMVPGYVVVESEAELDRAVHLHYPLIVKHPRGFNSVGLSRDSLVADAIELSRQVRIMIGLCGAALVEEFIQGREFTVLVAEPVQSGDDPMTLLPIEFVFPEGESFKHFDLKWIDYAEMKSVPVSDSGLAETLRQRVASTFLALGLDGYARCDLRMNQAGEIYFLEINANPGIFYPEGSFGSADIILSMDPLGHAGFLRHLISCAIRRSSLQSRPWRIGFDAKDGFGLVAARPIFEGETVVSYEERGVNLVSRQYVEANWRGMMRVWFDRYAYPVSDQVCAVWSEQPEQWRPVNHSCDPNLWLVGLDYVARRSIAPGEPLTSDYATFCGPGMASFACRCGSPLCRGTVRGTDCTLPELVERYGSHVTDFVRAERARCLHPGEAPYEVRSTPFGVGLFAMRRWRTGEKISDLFWGSTSRRPTRWTVQRDQHAHAEPMPHELRYINHSCQPTVFFDVRSLRVEALVDISPGDELTFFYPSTEWAMEEVFECGCGAAGCLGRISGASGLPSSVVQRYRFSGFVQERLREGRHGR